METTLVICYNLNDYIRWLINERGFQPRTTLRIQIHDGQRFIAVSEPEHMKGHKFHSIEYTDVSVLFNDDFQMLKDLCERHLTKEFKFGR